MDIRLLASMHPLLFSCNMGNNFVLKMFHATLACSPIPFTI